MGLPDGSVLPRHMAASSNGGSLIVPFSTASVLTPISVALGQIQVPAGRTWALAPVNTQIAHSVAGALFDCYMAIWNSADYSSPTKALLYSQGYLEIKTANVWQPFSFTGENFLDVAGVTPGDRRWALVFTNRTAGTLYVSFGVDDFAAVNLFGYAVA